ncbi:MAG: hypothetical protein A3K23_05300 [Desulfobacca sp. RBG_16_58_9]|nr:MAG: hypothetical protein A3K23_05300 [Desulfobacca sp. RBG_16_58_9]
MVPLPRGEKEGALLWAPGGSQETHPQETATLVNLMANYLISIAHRNHFYFLLASTVLFLVIIFAMIHQTAREWILHCPPGKT